MVPPSRKHLIYTKRKELNELFKKIADLPLRGLWCQWVELNHRPHPYEGRVLTN